MVVGGTKIVVSPDSPCVTVEVVRMEVVKAAVVVVVGEITVNSPAGEPDAIFRVAVRTNVEVLVTVTVQDGG